MYTKVLHLKVKFNFATIVAFIFVKNTFNSLQKNQSVPIKDLIEVCACIRQF